MRELSSLCKLSELSPDCPDRALTVVAVIIHLSTWGRGRQAGGGNYALNQQEDPFGHPARTQLHHLSKGEQVTHYPILTVTHTWMELRSDIEKSLYKQTANYSFVTE